MREAKMVEFKRKFGKRVKELRKSLNMTQEQLAEKIGMDTQNFCKMENGNHFPQAKNLVKIAETLNVDIKDLFDFNHISKKTSLVEEINSYLETATMQETIFIYKFIKNLQQYNKNTNI